MRLDRMDLTDEMVPWAHLMGELLDEAADYAQRHGFDRAAFLEAAERAYDSAGKPLDPFLSDHFRMIATKNLPPDAALVISGPLYDAHGNIRPQVLITGIGRADAPSAGGEE